MNNLITGVSICMATYNGEKYIEVQIQSIVTQLAANDELIISDDGSTDNTLQIIASFKDERIKIYLNNGNKGPIGNFQNALFHAKGDLIFLADQDDIWFPDKIKTMCWFLEEYDVVTCDCKVVDDNLEVLAPSYYAYINSAPGFIHNLKRNTYMGNCMAFKRNILKLVLPFPTNIPNHDLWIGVVADLFYKSYFIPQILGLHRRHNDNASNTFDVKLKTSIWRKINKRLILFYHLPALFIKKISI